MFYCAIREFNGILLLIKTKQKIIFNVGNRKQRFMLHAEI